MEKICYLTDCSGTKAELDEDGDLRLDFGDEQIVFDLQDPEDFRTFVMWLLQEYTARTGIDISEVMNNE